MGDSMVSTY